jgi:hypothetical protein
MSAEFWKYIAVLHNMSFNRVHLPDPRCLNCESSEADGKLHDSAAILPYLVSTGKRSSLDFKAVLCGIMFGTIPVICDMGVFRPQVSRGTPRGKGPGVTWAQTVKEMAGWEQTTRQ